jgi:predicted site-specific integrase-resolvase
MSKTLKEYALENRIGYRTAWNRFKAGKIEGATKTETGRVRLAEKPVAVEPKVAIYARVSSSENKSNLKSQAERLEHYARALGWEVVSVTSEIGSGVNDKRKKLEQLLKQKDWNILVVEHKDRLTRFGFNYIETLVELSGKRIEVVNVADNDKADLMQDLVAIIYSFSARMYGLRSAKRKTEQIVSTLESHE